MTNMKTILTWKKGIFANTYNIYSDGKLIGKMKNNCFSQSDDGELNGMKYTFKTKGLFKHHKIYGTPDGVFSIQREFK